MEYELNKDKRRRTDSRTGVYYGDYLQVDNLLKCVQPESEKYGKPAHDEHLFIVIHQTYELWFKQILHEMTSIMDIFSKGYVEERNMIIVINRMKRIVEIQKILVDQIKVLETMDALDFMDFRHHLTPASGFQSVQFRIIENRLGLQMEDRSPYQQKAYKGYFSENDIKILEESEKGNSLLKLIEQWLERTPGLEQGTYKFWTEYEKAVNHMLSETQKEVEGDTFISKEERELLLQAWEKNKSSFQTVLDPKIHAELVAEGQRRFSHKAFQGALMIYMYREEPKYSLPFQLLTLLTDMDASMTRWRHQHLQMVQRMIGSKVGTGGSSGYQYLRTTITDRYKVFLDLFNVPTYILPRRFIPSLPSEIAASLNYHQS